MNKGARAQEIEDWLREQALPLWSSSGLDREEGGFVERLHPDGAPDHSQGKRSMVQARQVYVYSHAALLGLQRGCEETAERGISFLLRHACPDGVINGFVHTLDRHGNVVHPVRDTYAHAFILHAFSWYFRATGAVEARQAIDDTIVAIERLRHVSGVGYAEGSENLDLRRQNPHMHLFEAYLAAFEATGREDMLERACEIYDLLVRYFFDWPQSALREYFNSILEPAAGAKGRIVEPGHHFEWIWLLDKLDALHGLRTNPVLTQGLYEKASAFGVDPHSKLVFDEIWVHGTIKSASKRLWSQTEAVKAELAMARRTGAATDVRLRALVDGLFRYFLSHPVRGAWHDRIDAQNNPVGGAVPASSFYHVFLASAEYIGSRMPRLLAEQESRSMTSGFDP